MKTIALALWLFIPPSVAMADLHQTCRAFDARSFDRQYSNLTPVHRKPAGEGINQDIITKTGRSYYQLNWHHEKFKNHFAGKICPKVAELQNLTIELPVLEGNNCKLMAGAYGTLLSTRTRFFNALQEIRRCYDGSKMPGAIRGPQPCPGGGKNAAHLKQAGEVAAQFSKKELSSIDPRLPIQSRLMAEHRAIFGNQNPYLEKSKDIEPYLEQQQAALNELSGHCHRMYEYLQANNCGVFLPPNLRFPPNF